MVFPNDKDLFKQMVLIRNVELKLLDMYSKGMLRGTVHTCIGQEACAVGVVSAIDRSKDILFSNHRGHGHFLAYCGDVAGLIAEIMGLESGICKGVGGSQHLQIDNFYSNGIQGAGTAISVGMGLAENYKGTGAVSLVFLGDGTFGEGTVYEAMNMASLWSVPILFVVENNGYAQTTPSKMQHAGELSRRAEPFGIPVTRLGGADVVEIRNQSEIILDEIRNGEGPQLLFLDTYRFSPHSKGDDFRDPKELEKMKRESDPIELLSKKLDHSTVEKLTQEAEQELSDILIELGVN